MSTGESDYAKRVVELSMQLANSRADVENLRMRIKAVDKEHEQLKKDRADMVDRFDAALRRAKAEGRQEGKDYAWNEAAMRAACAAHRACCGIEADNSQGKIHGCCVVCGVPWPCETAQFFLFKADARAAQIEEGE